MSFTRFFVYILECKNKAYYVGSASSVSARTETHNLGLGAKFTWKHHPSKLVYFEVFDTRKMAMRRERQIKGWTRAKKEKLIRGEWGPLI